MCSASSAPRSGARLTTTQIYETWDYRLIFSRQLPESERLQQLFDQGLQELKDSGRYAQLWQQFNAP